MKNIVIGLVILSNILFAQSTERKPGEKDFRKVKTPVIFFDIGYHFQNSLELEIGKANPENLGLYFNIYSSLNNPGKDAYSNISYNKAKYYFNDKELETQSYNWGATFGIVLMVTEKIYLNAGLQYQSIMEYIKFHDDFEILGDDGDYYIEGKSKSGMGVDLGLLHRIGESFSIKVGYVVGEYSSPKISFAWVW